MSKTMVLELSNQVVFYGNEVYIIGKSTNNDKYWYDRCVKGKMDGEGNPINGSFIYVYPEDNCTYEICFSYKEDLSADVPVFIYLNEVNKDGVKKAELIGFINRTVSQCVEFKSNGVNIFTPKYHIRIDDDGSIILYEIKNASYAYGMVRVFKPSEFASEIYNVRYGILVNKLKEIFKH